MPAYNRRYRLMMPCFALLALLLSGCKTNVPAPTTRADQLKQDIFAAQQRLSAAEDGVITSRVAMKRFLTRIVFEDVDTRTAEAGLQIQRLAFEKRELTKSYNTLRAAHDKLRDKPIAAVFDPTDQERKIIEESHEVREIDMQLEKLQAARKQQLAKFGDPKTAVNAIDKHINELNNERERVIDDQFRILFEAKLEQSALGVQILEQEIKRTDEALTEWTIKRQESVRLLAEYETLARNLKLAEDERDLAKQHLAELTAASHNSQPPQVPRQNTDR